MLFTSQCLVTSTVWRSLKRHFFNIIVSFDDGMFASCLVSDSAQFFHHYCQWPGKKWKISKHEHLLWSIIIMESEADESHHKSSPQRKYVETSHKLSFSRDIQEKDTEDVKKIHLPPSLQCRGISGKKIVQISNPVPLQEPDKKSIEGSIGVKPLPPSLRYKSRLEDDFGINKSLLPPQGRTDIHDFKNDFYSSFNSQYTSEREFKDTSKQQPLLDQKEKMAGKTKLQLPPSLLNFVENFVRENIKVVTDQVKKDSHEDSQKKVFLGGSPCIEFEDTESPFSNLNLFSSSESTDGSAVVQKKKSQKWSKKFSKKNILIALAVAILAFIISSLSRSECYNEEMVAKSREESGSFSVQSESDGTPDGKGKKKRPNYFIAIQVNNTEITKATMKIQSGIQEASGQDLSQLKIAPETLHITLMVMHLSSREEIDRASQCLSRCVPAIKKMHRDLPMTLEFEGLSGFSGGRVIFARIKDPGEETLHVMSDEVKKQMKDCGIEDSDPENKPFRPHLTLMKYSWKSKSKGPKKVEDSWYQAFASEYLGSQRINSLQLCKMQEKRDDGYYFVDQEVPF